MPVLQGKQYGSHIHVAGIMSLAKFRDGASAQG